ncbi:hypothetical protein PF005_g21658 [Phytophthora fragariae]|uniref:Secreted protein n=1 Tax=Phytophthora fragariae TaxID=53985 RepID=A0A6A3E8C5_9STRA|nr:hypothetical protein PF003_g33322 [Phytophthora fragariae]KAE8928713.1 hypothetical protein PF009_g21156 [Phytophthora fragariae]KAE9085037.1 hypothetical protein PF007_g21290 [Phytophthora fragariae]KAE9085582.1 hypothetical protein PF010_g20407 [Phytophthora fragariae]KAE9115906.1 hypothetical protein PF006_g19169 [Phytophthora fragariae]
MHALFLGALTSALITPTDPTAPMATQQGRVLEGLIAVRACYGHGVCVGMSCGKCGGHAAPALNIHASIPSFLAPKIPIKIELLEGVFFYMSITQKAQAQQKITAH